MKRRAQNPAPASLVVHQTAGRKRHSAGRAPLVTGGSGLRASDILHPPHLGGGESDPEIATP
jgi:hypothetical protein